LTTRTDPRWTGRQGFESLAITTMPPGQVGPQAARLCALYTARDDLKAESARHAIQRRD